MNSTPLSRNVRSTTISGAISLVVMSSTVVTLCATVIVSVMHAAAPAIAFLPRLFAVLV